MLKFLRYLALGLLILQQAPALAQNLQSVPFVQQGTGAVPRSVESRLRDVVSVKDFGATGLCLTDDTAAFQRAIDSVGSTAALRGGGVFVPAGCYLISSTLNFDHKSTMFYGVGPGQATGSTKASVLKWNGAAGSPMVKINRSRGGYVGGLRFHGNSSARPSAAIELHVDGVSPINSRLRLERLWIGYFIGDSDSGAQFVSGIVTTGSDLQDDQSSMSDIVVQSVTAYCVQIAGSQNVLWEISNAMFNGGAGATGLYTAARHTTLRNVFFQTNLESDIKIASDGSVDAYQIGSEASKRLLVATAGAEFRVRGGYFQSGADATGAVIDITGSGTSVVRLEDFHFTRNGPFVGPETIKMRGPGALLFVQNISLLATPEQFLDLTTTTASDYRYVQWNAGVYNFVNRWSHGEATTEGQERTDFYGLARFRIGAASTTALEVVTQNLGATKFSVSNSGLVFGDHSTFTADNTHDFGSAGAARPRTIYLGTSAVIGTDPGSTGALRVGGYMQFGNSAEPTCNSTNRGSVVLVQGGAGVADTFRVCGKNAADVYSYQPIATFP